MAWGWSKLSSGLPMIIFRLGSCLIPQIGLGMMLGLLARRVRGSELGFAVSGPGFSIQEAGMG